MLDERVTSSRTLEHHFGPVAILDVGAMNVNSKQATVSIGQDMTLAALDLLARVVASRALF